MEHVNAIEHLPNQNKRVCSVCGVRCQHLCKKCGVALHFPSYVSKEGTKVCCFLQYHNTNFYGLAKDDRTLVGVKHKDFAVPNENRVAEHSLAMKRLRSDVTSPQRLPIHTPTDQRKRTHRSSGNNSNKRARRSGDDDSNTVEGDDDIVAVGNNDAWNDRCV